MTFSICLDEMVFLFFTNKLLPFCQKCKNDLLSKNTLKDDISGIIKKYDVYRRKYDISSDRKIKDHKKHLLSQICMRRTGVINVNNTSSKFVITNFPSLIC